MRGVKTNLVGQRFGKLSVVGEMPERSHGNIIWLALCDCGVKVEVPTVRLCGKRKPTRSCGCLGRGLPGQAARSKVLRDYKNNAKKRSLEWGLLDTQFDLLTQANCHYCGCKPSSISHPEDSSNGDFHYNGIDRVNNDLGYIDGNVLPCCRTCNWAKGGKSYQEFMGWVTTLVQYQTQKQTSDLSVRASA